MFTGFAVFVIAQFITTLTFCRNDPGNANKAFIPLIWCNLRFRQERNPT